jgi:tRNA dimethylallyltransferase
MPEKPVILIAGPTASGKSAAALALAEEIGAEILNADALQVYRDLRILSARPSESDEARAPHRLYGFADGSVRYSVGQWLRDIVTTVADAHARGLAAVIVGGTGLYFRALEQGLAKTPPVPSEVRAAARRRLAEVGLAAFREEVLAFDPGMARLAATDRQRHLRAWEVYRAGGRPLSDLHRDSDLPARPTITARLIIEPPREAIYAAVEGRFDAMMRNGGLEEARRLFARALDPELPVMKAVGAAELLSHLAGHFSLDEAVVLAKRNSRRFAKRQLTWFRRQAAQWPRAATWTDGVGAVRRALQGGAANG